jgi:acetate kinase
MTQVLVLNTGSSSVKFELFEVVGDDLASRASGLVEGIGEPVGAVRVALGDEAPDAAHEVVAEAVGEATIADHAAALGIVMDLLGDAGVVADVVAIGHRVVHGGEAFTAPTVITDEVVATLDQLAPLAPLHNPPALVGIRVARDLYPDLAHVAVFDTAFHMTMAPEAYRYAVPAAWYHEHGVRRFGFHGTSHRFVAESAAQALGRPLEDLQLITLHLGNGASAAAIAGGHVIDTSMGMSPLEGLVMGTRSGDVDPGVIFHMVRAGLPVDEVERQLNRESGLKGLAGRNDVRALRVAAADGDADARLALDVMTRRVRGRIGTYWAHLSDVDAVVFTAGIGEHDAATRTEVIEPLGHLGLVLDARANAAADPGDGPVVVSPAGVAPAVVVVATAEELVIARDTLATI